MMEKTKDFGTLLERVGKTHGVAPIVPQKRFFSTNSGPSEHFASSTFLNDDKRSVSEQLEGYKVAFFFGEAFTKQAISDEKNLEVE